ASDSVVDSKDPGLICDLTTLKPEVEEVDGDDQADDCGCAPCSCNRKAHGHAQKDRGFRGADPQRSEKRPAIGAMSAPGAPHKPKSPTAIGPSANAGVSR